MNRVLSFVILFVLVLSVGFFSASETAYLSLTKLKLRKMLDQKAANAKLVYKLKSNMDRLLTEVLIGTNFLNSLASALATALAIDLLGKSPIQELTPFITAFFMTSFGQIIPKTLADKKCEKITSFTSVPLIFFQKIFFPIIWVFEKFSHFAVWLIEKLMKPSGQIVTEEELKSIIDIGENEGTIEKSQSKMLNKLIRFNDVLVKDIMRHTSFIGMVDIEASYNEVVQEFNRSGYSTMVVYSGEKTNVLGVINYKTLLTANVDPNKSFYAKSVMKDVAFVPGSFSALELLHRFRIEEHKFTVVLNEQGEAIGIATMEDILRFVFGRMTDENSYNQLPPEEKIKLLSSKSFLVPGEIKIDDVNEILNLKLESDTVTTLGGWLLEKFGHLPNVGEVLTYDHKIFSVEDISHLRISMIKILM